MQMRKTLDEELSAMADDPEIQQELRLIEAEFAGTQADGLDELKILFDIAWGCSANSGDLDH